MFGVIVKLELEVNAESAELEATIRALNRSKFVESSKKREFSENIA